jgi:hypothetical protein
MTLEVLATTVTVTGFVLVMMLLVELLNVISRGALRRRLYKGGGRVPAALIGTVPGCFGGFVNVTLYVHGAISLGALAGGMIATSGDEAFVMLAMFPRRALLLFGLLFGYGLLVAFVVDRLGGMRRFPRTTCESGLAVHEEEASSFRLLAPWRPAWRWSRDKAWLVAFIAAFILAVGVGWVAGDEPLWLRGIVGGLGLTVAGLILAAPGHFVHVHLVRHVVREHAPRIFLWTFGALLVTEWVTTAYPGLEAWIRDHQALALVVAALVGLVPESGPHLVFATLYSGGVVPFSVLATSSAVQDGHGMLPLLAESPTEFMRVKAINLVAGLVLGCTIMLMGI